MSLHLVSPGAYWTVYISTLIILTAHIQSGRRFTILYLDGVSFFCPASKQRKDPGNEVESFLFLMITLLMIWYNSFNVIVNGVAGVGRQADQ